MTLEYCIYFNCFIEDFWATKTNPAIGRMEDSLFVSRPHSFEILLLRWNVWSYNLQHVAGFISHEQSDNYVDWNYQGPPTRTGVKYDSLRWQVGDFHMFAQSVPAALQVFVDVLLVQPSCCCGCVIVIMDVGKPLIWFGILIMTFLFEVIALCSGVNQRIKKTHIASSKNDSSHRKHGISRCLRQSSLVNLNTIWLNKVHAGHLFVHFFFLLSISKDNTAHESTGE